MHANCLEGQSPFAGFFPKPETIRVLEPASPSSRIRPGLAEKPPGLLPDSLPFPGGCFSDDPGRRAKDEGVGGDDRPGCHDGAGSHDGAFTDDGVVKDYGTGPDEDAGGDVGPVDDGRVADDGPVANGDGRPGGRLQKRQIKDGGLFADDGACLIGPDDRQRPDAGALPDNNITDYPGGVVDEGGVVDDGARALE